MLFSMLLGVFLREKLNFCLWTSIAISVVAVVVLGQLHDMIWIARWRPEVRRFLQLHAAEIERVV